jgi:divalent metal cation (Fe/Co/Zn/Cd) transporter
VNPHPRHRPQQKIPNDSLQPFVLALATTIALVVMKALGAWWGHSLALAADAGHSLGDVGALGLA